MRPAPSNIPETYQWWIQLYSPGKLNSLTVYTRNYMISPLLAAVCEREIWLMSYLGFTWLLGIELRSLCFNGKYFTDWAASPILHTDLCERYVKSTTLPLQWWKSDAIYAVLPPPVQSITKHLNPLFVIVLKHILFLPISHCVQAPLTAQFRLYIGNGRSW